MINQVNWQKVDGLVPAVVQDANSKDVLMLGYMNQEALAQTIETRRVTFFSRSKSRLWTKGETSGHFLELEEISLDCDQDTFLIKARPIGPTCHLGTKTCFGDVATDVSFLKELSNVIEQRFEQRPEGSYVSRLIDKGLHKMAQKVGEEGVEVALAAKDDDKQEFLGESADLLFHLMVLLKAKNCTIEEVCQVLYDRHSNQSPS
ncbi:bifunctional phosphoribosyl-AMP cyclohydrolase/phosphoribosyl-ATP diphosphatase HisIE [Pseudobacteriovorax antillogorgiicola]|uniref:Histidine biosynthesis bifunctional protein HisIE n=1 Tax=Pseudobacteriovorax antillogorgiicola TaxID=1513793 RepID=A0A1Y6CMR6_9BACT|nr:bifunctional phosphoribosyl-AMP cyclohydrolase/phosphoribosyl-ATP diphosphatase HisIE [Pseudobacteriovorax antillogorgiicola]TCS44610.1 phosphoribosyl-ATP pyrophosphatase /phosphoribosyl-AMP cyclohydrolase [Pseudobacteriovorax antillogorgiicola]SMF78266.1 phosphoribosyl-ATP pyrophosphatase /phosphoribosyl-AMP cyclohydrolase [Pseudobacteriovorax antillogorgiicola]